MNRSRWTTLSLALVALVAAGCGDDDDELSANAGDDATVAVGESPTLDGCGSSGDIVNYAWTIRDAPVADDVGKAIKEQDENCSYTIESAMVVDEVGVWAIELQVTDDGGNTSVDTVEITVTE